MYKFKKILKKLGVLEIIRLPIYPVTLLFIGPIRLIATLYNSIILVFGKWSNYHGYSARYSINQLFYKTQCINIDRYGRNGYSQNAGIGNFYMGRLFHLSLPSTYLYNALGAVLPLISMAVWLLSHFIWFEISHVNITWLLLVLILASISTTFYNNTFISQNYNVLGWALFPLALWATLNGYYISAGILWILITLGSVTAGAVSIILLLSGGFLLKDIYLIYISLPIIFKLFIHLYWVIERSSDGLNSLNKLFLILRTIGTVSKGAKYNRKNNQFNLTHFYFFILYVQFIIINYVYFGFYESWFIYVGFSIFFINSYFSRFADPQSMQILMLTLFTASIINNHNYYLLASYWVSISPLPMLLTGGIIRGKIDIPKAEKPFCLSYLYNKMGLFLADIKENEKVLFIFDNPKDEYDNIFDGQRHLLELPFYIAAINNFKLFPNWDAIYENNYVGAPEFWGRDLNSINKNIGIYNVDYIIVYQDSGTQLSDLYSNNQFKVLSHFDWGKEACNLNNEKLWESDKPPCWWLLKIINK